jgi:hypothetical protein
MRSGVNTNILTEDVVTTKEACQEFEPIFGKPIDRTTFYRWAFRGFHGVCLEHAKLGGRIVTSRQAIARFIEARSKV